LKRVCNAAFSDTFVSWMHMKAMRVFVESTLRFGVPANFSAFMVKPAKNKTKKYRVALDELFGASGLYGSNTIKPQAMSKRAVRITSHMSV